jgi:hypothetical protein
MAQQVLSLIGLTGLTGLTGLVAWTASRLNKPAFFPKIDYTTCTTLQAIELLQEHPDERMRKYAEQSKKFLGVWNAAFVQWLPIPFTMKSVVGDQTLVDLANALLRFHRQPDFYSMDRFAARDFETSRKEGRDTFLDGVLAPSSYESTFWRALQTLGVGSSRPKMIYATSAEQKAYWRLQFEVSRRSAPIAVAHWVVHAREEFYPEVQFKEIRQVYAVALGDTEFTNLWLVDMFLKTNETQRPYRHYPKDFWQLWFGLNYMNTYDNKPLEDCFGNLPVPRLHGQFTELVNKFRQDVQADINANRNMYPVYNE